MIEQTSLPGLSARVPTDFAPKRGLLEGTQQQAANSLWRLPDGRLEIGRWDCPPTRLSAERGQPAGEPRSYPRRRGGPGGGGALAQGRRRM